MQKFMKNKVFLIITTIVIVLVIFLSLEFFGIIWHTNIFASKYEVKGLDVSNHQGKIDWVKVTENSEYQFVFIKATEGDDYADKFFTKNWEQAKANGLYVGAYHFFTTGSSGFDQAEWFKYIVPITSGMLPPVVDVEVFSSDKENFIKELQDFVNEIERHYGIKPIIYTMYRQYDEYIEEYFSDYDIWIRDLIKTPNLDKEKDWTFWQYCNRGHIPGIEGYVDINVFYGTDDLMKAMVNERTDFLGETQ